MSISGLFTLLGAPLANNRWSWGSQRASDGAVFLRVWQDLKFDKDGRIHMLVCPAVTHSDEESENLGFQERVRHTESIRSGKPCFMVMCLAKDVEDPKRTILDFDDRDIFIGGDIIETPKDFQFPPKTSDRARFLARNGATWVQLAGRKPVSSIKPA